MASSRFSNLDPASIKLPESPEKRSLRAMKSHSQLASQPSLISQQRQHRTGLAVRPSREHLNPGSNNVPSLPTRARANSDAPAPFERQPLRTARKPLLTPNDAHKAHTRKSSLEMTLREGPPPGTDVATALNSLRHSILTSRVAATKEGMSDYRIYLWLALLNVPILSTETYLGLVHRGKSPAYEKISNDVFRTLATDTLFKRRVTDASLTRLLNATAWTLHDIQSQRKKMATTTTTAAEAENEEEQISIYNQGMNVLSAPFLYTSRSEAEAFALFSHFLLSEVPGYIHPTFAGVHRGLALVDKCLAIINPTLSNYLLDKGLPAKIYAFPSVLTFCACTPPLPEVLHLWDFLFAYGPHLNILCIVAQLLLLKDALLANPSPSKLLRSFPALDAEQVIKMTLLIIKQIPEDVYAELVVHAR